MLVPCNCKLLAEAALQGQCWGKLCLEKNAAFSEHSMTGTILHSNNLSVRQVCVAEFMDFLGVAITYITLIKPCSSMKVGTFLMFHNGMHQS